MDEEKKIKFKDKKPWQKILSILSYILISLFALFAVVSVVFTVCMKVSGNDTMVFGNTEIRLVQTGSMEWNEHTPDSVKGYSIKEIKTHDAVFIQKRPTGQEELLHYYDNLAVGDVVNFSYKTGGELINVTHRIVFKEKYLDGYKFVMQGDNWSDATGPAYQYVYTSTDKGGGEYLFNEILGTITKVSSPLGGFLSFIKSKWVIICIIIVPCAGIIIYEIIRIILVLTEDKRKLKASTTANKDLNSDLNNLNNEEQIELLKKMLSEKEEELKNKDKK